MAATKRTASVASKKQKIKNNNDDSLGELPEGLSDSEDSLLLPTKKNNNEEKKTPGGAKRKRKTASSSPTSSLKSGAISNSEGEDLTTDGKKLSLIHI